MSNEGADFFRGNENADKRIDEDRKYIMKRIDLQEMQQLELNILLELDRFCQENGLVYYLAYGSLLGAVRHKGFIPWDDDVDVWMPRPDYDKLMRLFHHDQKGTKIPYYRLVTPMDRDSRPSFVKIMDTRTIKKEKNCDYSTGGLGVEIDVFPFTKVLLEGRSAGSSASGQAPQTAGPSGRPFSGRKAGSIGCVAQTPLSEKSSAVASAV